MTNRAPAAAAVTSLLNRLQQILATPALEAVPF